MAVEGIDGERWLRWKVYAGDTALVAGLAAGLYVAFGLAGFSAWSVPGFLAAAALAGRVYKGRGGRVRAAQRARQQRLARDARREERPPILLLRSFLSSVTMPAPETIRVFGTDRPINDEDSPAAPRSHVLTLAAALRTSGPIVAIGPARSGTAGAARVDVLFLEPADADWFAVFETVSLGSRAIVMLPGETQGVVQEIESLRRRRLLGKLILVMPALRRHPGIVPWLRVDVEQVVRGWEAARERFGALGIVLPDYDPQGMVFALDEGGRVRERAPFGRSFISAARTIRTFAPPDGHPTARPLRDIMRDLEPYDLAARVAGPPV